MEKRLVDQNIKLYIKKQWLDAVTHDTGFEQINLHNIYSKPLKL